MSVLNFHLVANRELFSTGTIESIINDIGLNAEVSRIFSINNWQWEEKQLLNSKEEIVSCLLYRKIIVVDFDAKNSDNFGMYIEKIGVSYIYSFWWSTNSAILYQIDCEEFFQCFEVSSMFNRMILAVENYCIDFNSIAFGEETIYCYSDIIENMVEESHNVIFWLLKNSIEKIPNIEKIAEIPSLKAFLYKSKSERKNTD